MADKSIVSNSKLTAIANAIRSKTGTTASLTLDAMANEINSIETGTSSVNVMKALLDGRKSANYLFNKYSGTSVDDLISYSDTENVTYTGSMFLDCPNLQTIPLLDTSKVTNMYGMFYNCTNLQTIPQLDTSNVIYMESMFQNCTNLQTIPELDTSNVTNMKNMFHSCTNLQTISPLNTSNVTQINSVFISCIKLQTIDITSLDKISSTSNMHNFAAYCASLTKLIIRNMTVIPPLNTNSFKNCLHFDGLVNAEYNPEGLKDGRIYVPDDKVEELKVATNWSAYADIIVPLSTLIE